MLSSPSVNGVSAVHRVSFAIGLIASTGLMVFPFILHGVPASRVHAGLPIMMLGVAGTFVHGIGYCPTHVVPRFLFSLSASWVLIGFGTFILSGR